MENELAQLKALQEVASKRTDAVLIADLKAGVGSTFYLELPKT